METLKVIVLAKVSRVFCRYLRKRKIFPCSKQGNILIAVKKHDAEATFALQKRENVANQVKTLQKWKRIYH